MRKTSAISDLSKIRDGNQINVKKINVGSHDKLDEELLIDEDGTGSQKYLFKVLPIQTIDLISFWIFLFLYIIFNCVYWLYYLTTD